MTIHALVTGANGFIGQHLVDDLLEEEWHVDAASRRPLPPAAGLVHVPAPNLGDSAAWAKLVKHSYDVVIHLAGRAHVMRDDPARTLAENMAINTDGTEAVAAAAEAAGVRKFVFVSSVKVYGDRPSEDRPIKPTDPAAPDDPYGVSKLRAEQRLQTICAGSAQMQAVVIRPTLVYGPGVKANFRSMLRWVETGIPLPLGSVHNRRSMVYVKNLNSLIKKVALSDAAGGRTYLAADANDASTTELLRSIADLMDKPSRLVPVPVPVLRLAAKITGRSAVARRLLDDYRVDITQATKELGWAPPYTWRDGLADTVSSYIKSTRVGR